MDALKPEKPSMGGMNAFVEAPTITELMRKVQETAAEMRKQGMTVHHHWDPDKVEKTDNAFRFWVHAHS